MLSLKTVGRRFEVPLKVISGGSGIVHAIISETDQTQIPSYIFVPPRRIARVLHPTALKPRHVVETPIGMRFIVGENGPSEQVEGVLWQSFRLFQVTHQLSWTRRKSVIDAVTKQKREDGIQNLGMIHVALEPTDREEDERRLATQVEKARYITNADVRSDDLIGDYRVIRSDEMLGVTIGMVQY